MNEHEQNVLGKAAIGICVAGIFVPLLMVILVMVTQSPPQYYSDMKQLTVLAFEGCQIIAVVAGAFAWRSLFGKAAMVMAGILMLASLLVLS